MNGAEAALVELAQRSQRAAQEAASSLLECRQMHSRLEREILEARAERQAMRKEMRQGFEALNAALLRDADDRSKLQHATLTEEDWEDSPTGQHKMVSRRTFDAWQRRRELSEAAKKWRKALSTSGKVALALVLVVLGWAIRHLLGKP